MESKLKLFDGKYRIIVTAQKIRTVDWNRPSSNALRNGRTAAGCQTSVYQPTGQQTTDRSGVSSRKKPSWGVQPEIADWKCRIIVKRKKIRTVDWNRPSSNVLRNKQTAAGCQYTNRRLNSRDGTQWGVQSQEAKSGSSTGNRRLLEYRTCRWKLTVP